MTQNMDMNTIFAINDADLQGEFVRFPGEFAWVGVQYGNATGAAVRAHIDADRVKGETDKAVRANAAMTGTKVTEPSVASALDVNPDFIAARIAEADALAAKERWRGYFNAMQAKGDMLNNLGAHERAMAKSDPASR
jgi:hypothetical protein